MASEVGVLDIPPENIVRQGAAAAGPHVPGRHGAGPHRRRRGDQARAGGARSRTASGCSEHLIDDRRPARGAVPAAARSRDRAAPAAGVRLHARRPAAAARADGDATARSRSARWAPTRRWRCCRTGRGCSTTTSSSCSRRSPTRRSTRSARSSSRRWSRRSGRRATCSSREPESCRQIKIKYPIIDNDQLAKLRHIDDRRASGRSRCRCCSTRARAARASSGRWTSCARSASEAVDAGYNILILSDRGVDRELRADPEPAGDGRRAPSPGPRRHAHALRAGRRVGRRARSASLSRCCSATAPARSTRTWRSRRSTT